MKQGKIKLVVILVALILIGGLLPIAKRVSAKQDTGEQADLPVPPPPQQILTSNSNQQSAIPGGREFFYKMVLSILVVAAFGVGAIYLSKKLLPKLANHQGKQIRVIETTYIAPRKGIHLIQVGSRRLLVASTNETVTMLADVTESASNFAAELAARS
jgi:flagellar biosynthetic protein FliO